MILGKLIEQWRTDNNISLRRAAGIIGIEYTCLHRFEKGRGIDGQTVGRVLQWIFSEGPLNPVAPKAALTNDRK